MDYGLGYSLAGLIVGIAVGATGVGGGSLMTPVLILFYGISPKLAVGTDLLYASISKSFNATMVFETTTIKSNLSDARSFSTLSNQ